MSDAKPVTAIVNKLLTRAIANPAAPAPPQLQNPNFFLKFVEKPHVCDGRHTAIPNSTLSLYQERRARPLQASGDRTMSWQKSAVFTVDCMATFVGLLLALPFVMILASPFMVSY